MDEREHKITQLLVRAGDGDRRAASELLPLVYDELKGLAHARVARSGKNRTVRTTDLVHSSWLRLVGAKPPNFESRRHFFGAASRAMRNIMVEEARRRRSLKRDRGREEEIDAELPVFDDGPPVEDILSLNDALELLEAEHERPSRVVVLRYFGGLSMPEVADVLEVSLATAERDWRFASAFLRRELEQAS